MESMDTLYFTIDVPVWRARAIPDWRLTLIAALDASQSPRWPAHTLIAIQSRNSNSKYKLQTISNRICEKN